jgi:asparagine synthetase B (glutamine-hydrolysing)
MIGLFGIFRKDPEAPADPSSMAGSLPSHFEVASETARGAALGRVWHAKGGECSHAESEDGRFCAIASGKIFNQPNDSEASYLLRVVRDDRLDDLSEVNGQFCGAVYDRNIHRLFLITDRLASFPLHIYERNGDIVFATQLHTLIAHPEVPKRADQAAIAQLFTMQRTIGAFTPIAGVSALPAGSVVSVDREGRQERRYWRLAWKVSDKSQTETADALALALRHAVARQAQDEKTALLLSGGVDSRLVLAAAPERRLSCWTTASYQANPELEKARRIAAMFSAEHHALVVPPADTLPILEQTVIESSGLYPASTPMSAFLPAVGDAANVALTGHGLDYTLRGYYLPAKFLEVAGSRTRLPTLRGIASRPSGKDVFENLRQGPPRTVIDRIVRQDKRDEWWASQEASMEKVLAPWLDSEDPYNAWDGFLLHAVSKHYAFTGMMAVRAVCNLHMPAFDNEVFELYLGMPPAWRCSGRVVQLALQRLSREAARFPNANTGFRADLHPWLEIAGLLGRAALRKLGLNKRPHVPGSTYSPGSWQNIPALYRDDPAHQKRFQDIRARLDYLAFDLFDTDALACCIEEHLDGTANHTKFLRQLLTHDAWVREFGISGSA